jgi:hypothetical protein
MTGTTIRDWLRKLKRFETEEDAGATNETQREIQEGLDLHFGSNHAGGHHDELRGADE